MKDPQSQTPAAWLTTTVQHEGYPLALRVRPSADSQANREAFPVLGVLTHQLDHVSDNGLPRTDYNDGLEAFDLGLQEAVGHDSTGLVVLIETFAGKRTYYAYVHDEQNFRQRVAAISAKFPQHRLNITCKRDSAWKFYQEYRREFSW